MQLMGRFPRFGFSHRCIRSDKVSDVKKSILLWLGAGAVVGSVYLSVTAAPTIHGLPLDEVFSAEVMAELASVEGELLTQEDPYLRMDMEGCEQVFWEKVEILDEMPWEDFHLLRQVQHGRFFKDTGAAMAFTCHIEGEKYHDWDQHWRRRWIEKEIPSWLAYGTKHLDSWEEFKDWPPVLDAD